MKRFKTPGRSTTTALGGLALLALANAPAAFADVITINNPSFEDTALADGASTPVVNGWSGLTGATVLNPSATHFPGGNTSNGANLLVLQAPGAAAPATAQQTLAATLEYGFYQLKFDVGNRLDAGMAPLTAGLRVNGNLLTPDFTFIPAPGEGLFENAQIGFTVTPTNANGVGGFGGAIQIEFQSTVFMGASANIDNVFMDFTPAAVPEPVLGLPLTLACVALTMIRRRQVRLVQRALA